MQLLVAAQRDVRNRALSALHAGLGTIHSSQRVSVVARYADRRAAAAALTDPAARTSALRALVQEEAAELAQLALAQAQERRRFSKDTLATLAVAQAAARRGLRRTNRRSKIVMAVRLRSRAPTHSHQRADAVRLRPRIAAQRLPRLRKP